MQRNKEYNGEISTRTLLKPELIKLYYANILGKDRQDTQWENSDISRKEVEETLKHAVQNSTSYGIPHIAVSFPHVTTLYRWGDPRINGEAETNVKKVGAANTSLMISGEDDINKQSTTVGCPLELCILAEEVFFRAISRDIEQYLRTFVQTGLYHGSGIRNPNMILDHLISQKIIS